MFKATLNYVAAKAINVRLINDSRTYEAIATYIKANFSEEHIEAMAIVYADYDSKHRWFDEAVALASEVSKTITKVFGDSVTLTDSFLYLYDHAPDDSAAAADQTELGLIKKIIDVNAPSDNASISILYSGSGTLNGAETNRVALNGIKTDWIT